MWSSKRASPPAADSPTDVESTPSPVSGRQRNPGRRFAQIVKLKPEFVDKYKEVHAKVWPEVLQQIKECNIVDYSIFHDPESRTLFASFKYVGYDYAGDMEKMRENPKVREWWAMTDGWQESVVPGAVSSEAVDAPSWWKPVEEVFYTA
ncbi:hypothetical protein CkaCkLH20_10552 [Colletotrichum karsti]|uniref:L-rhamnose mutarotase n=1 Tax=Colletotrichum karsti TaxID=1095194 RepID=A0A9P6LGT6_9PEZI|nr:uncharacterized protein CkaCkLH20_10552 [Colletotrichum karsti]KAF9871920.1 hypothetical protein CkaCkLH20_10552 [Colletotrichum karsti]